MFPFLYFLFCFIIYILFLPFLVILSFKKKYKKAILARFWGIKNSPLHKNSIHFHACSLGEVNSLEPLLKKFKNEKIAVSVVTNTGFEAALKFKAKNLLHQVRFLPYELLVPFWLKRQKLVVILEAEFWYFFVLFAKLKGSKVVFLNARISDRSAKKYLRMKWFYNKIFAHVNFVFAQGNLDAKRFYLLGAKNIKSIGNFKLAFRPEVTYKLEKPNKKLLILASTHEGEEALLLEAIDFSLFCVVVAPRHPERFETVQTYLNTFCKRHDLSFKCFTQNTKLQCDVTLIDQMGELINFYAISDVVILGGSFVPKGGHNPLEVIYFDNVLVTGPHIFNQKEIYKYIDHVIFSDECQIKQSLQLSLHAPKTKLNGTFDLDKIVQDLKNIMQNGVI